MNSTEARRALRSGTLSIGQALHVPELANTSVLTLCGLAAVSEAADRGHDSQLAAHRAIRVTTNAGAVNLSVGELAPTQRRTLSACFQPAHAAGPLPQR